MTDSMSNAATLILYAHCGIGNLVLWCSTNASAADRKRAADTDLEGRSKYPNAAAEVPTVEVWPQFIELVETETAVWDLRTVNVGVDDPLEQSVPSKNIYVRECYKQLAPRITKLLEASSSKLVIVTGSPGIGKSLFGLLFLIDIVKKMKAREANGHLEGITHVLYEHAAAPGSVASYFVVDVDSATILKIRNDQAWNYFNVPTTLLIKDGACKEFGTLCPVLWFSSPRPNSLRKRQGERSTKTLYVPPTDACELIECMVAGCAPPYLFEFDDVDVASAAHKAMEEAESHIGEDELDNQTDRCAARRAATIERWTADLGPCARRVFNPQRGYDEVDGALKQLGKVDFLALRRMVDDDSDSVAREFKLSHRLVIMSPSPDYTSARLTIASKMIARRILNFELEDTLREVKSMLGKIHGTREGLAFEPYAHEILRLGGKWPMKMLTDDATGCLSNDLELKQLKEMKVANSDIKHGAFSSIGPDEYFIPEDPTFPVVDAWSKEWLFQMTVSETHPLKTGSQLFRMLRETDLKPRGIVFVVPKRMYAEYKKQPLVCADGKIPVSPDGPQGGWNDLIQFVVGIGE